MDQGRYWMWAERKMFGKSSVQSTYKDWEEQAFVEDSSGALGDCVWPPRSYSCGFCKREFRSAQALGGHMNVHRRDRARLKQSPNAHVEISHHYHRQNPCTPLAIHYPSELCTLAYHDHHYPKALSPVPVAALLNQGNCREGIPVSMGTSLPFSLNGQNHGDSETKLEMEASRHKKIMRCQLQRNLGKPDLLMNSSKSIRNRRGETDPSGCEDETLTTKRRRLDSSSLPLFREFNSSAKAIIDSSLSSSLIIPSTVEKHHREFQVPSSIEELDLELRLGDRPKV